MSEKPKEKKKNHKGAHHAPWAIVAAAIVLVVVLSLVFRGGEDGGLGADEAVASIIRKAHKIDPVNFEPMEAVAEEVGDWLLTKGFEGYRVPADLAGLDVSGCTVTKDDVTPMAVLLLEDGSMRACVFPLPPGVNPGPDEVRTTFELPAANGSPRLGVAADTAAGICFAVLGPGGAAEVERWTKERTR